MVVHRDISANNIMIDKGGRGLLVDWDFSKSIDEKKKERQQPERTVRDLSVLRHIWTIGFDTLLFARALSCLLLIGLTAITRQMH